MLSLDLENKIRVHLRGQYKGILSPDQIEKHIENYIGDLQSTYLIQKVSPLIPKGAKILDVGSGYGSFTLAAHKRGYQSTGIEIEEFEHSISQEKARLEGINSSIFVQGSALKLPFSNHSFDAVTFWNVLEHVPNYKEALKEACRVLIPGGQIFIIAPNYLSFRREAHYHVPWLPLFPKSLASRYLKLIGRNPSFLHSSIFYITLPELKSFLKQSNLRYSTDIVEKIKNGHSFKSPLMQFLIRFSSFKGGLNILSRFIDILKLQPFAQSIDMIIKK